jgi:hypothetical protein
MLVTFIQRRAGSLEARVESPSVRTGGKTQSLAILVYAPNADDMNTLLEATADFKTLAELEAFILADEFSRYTILP